MNRLFAAIGYVRYPIKDEFLLRAFVQVYFSGAGLNTRIVHHNAHGRTDLEVEIRERTGYLNLKFSEKEKARNPNYKKH